MSKKSGSRSPGSIILQLAIVLLIVVLILAIQVPKGQWNQQVEDEALCRDHMENVYFAAKFYNKLNRGYVDDITEILKFAEQESIKVFPPGFKLDRLTRQDSGIDSFQVEYYDPYQLFSHYEKAVSAAYPAGNDSLVLNIVPLPQFGFAPRTKYTFASDVPISSENIDRGDQGIFMYVGAQGALRTLQILGEPLSVPANQYIYSLDPEGIHLCPTTGTPYKLMLNVKIGITAEMRALIEEDPQDPTISSSPLFSSLLVFRLLKESDARARRDLLQAKASETVEDSLISIREWAFIDSAAASIRSEGLNELAEALSDSFLAEGSLPADQIDRWDRIKDAGYSLANSLKTDSLIQTMRDDIILARMDILTEVKFAEGIEKLLQDRASVVIETGTVHTTSDSIDYYSNPELIKARLFKLRKDSATQQHLENEAIRKLLTSFTYVESYRASRVDSVGLTIQCPVEGKHRKDDRSLLARIFSVEGATNHGEVENSDLSWSEKR